MYPDYLTKHHNDPNELLISIDSTSNQMEVVEQIDEALNAADYGRTWIPLITREHIEQAVIESNIEPIEFDAEEEPHDYCVRYLALICNQKPSRTVHRNYTLGSK